MGYTKIMGIKNQCLKVMHFWYQMWDVTCYIEMGKWATCIVWKVIMGRECSAGHFYGYRVYGKGIIIVTGIQNKYREGV